MTTENVKWECQCTALLKIIYFNAFMLTVMAEFSKPLHLAYIDLKLAFDSVDIGRHCVKLFVESESGPKLS